MKPRYEDIANPDLPDEIWKPVPGFGNRYLASNKGRIKLINGGKGKNVTKILGTYDNGIGYRTVKLWKNKRRITRYVQQVVASAWLGECPKDPEINHKDKNKENNTPDNLEYVTRSQNLRHAHNHEDYDKYKVVATFSVDTYEDAEYLKAVLQNVFYDLPLVLK